MVVQLKAYFPVLHVHAVFICENPCPTIRVAGVVNLFFPLILITS
jgi:hypothetical protein